MDLNAMAPSLPVLSVGGHVATITLNRPAHRNRLEDPDLKALLSYAEQLNANPEVRVVVLTANTDGMPRPVFCSGYHIGNFANGDVDPDNFSRVADALATMRAITICALNGSVYGGATDLFLACDLRVALAGAEFRMPACALGLHYYPSGLRRYVQRLGIGGAKRAFLTARPLKAEDLDRLNAVDILADASSYAAELQALVREVAALAPLAAQETKKSLNTLAQGEYPFELLLERERLTQNSEDFQEGRNAFFEKRKPVFKGR